MPIHTFRNEDGSTFEHLFFPGEEVPKELNGAVRLFPLPGMVKLDKHFHFEERKLPPNHQVLEPGMLADQKRYKKEREDRWKKTKKKIAEDSYREAKTITLRH